MPTIQWQDLPPALRDDLLDRLRERKITTEDLYAPKLWRESEPEAPDGAPDDGFARTVNRFVGIKRADGGIRLL